MRFSALRSLTQPCMTAYCICHNTYDPGISPGSANKCILWGRVSEIQSIKGTLVASPMSSKFDLCLLLYVMRLLGWLKHCNLSPPSQGSSGVVSTGGTKRRISGRAEVHRTTNS